MLDFITKRRNTNDISCNEWYNSHKFGLVLYVIYAHIGHHNNSFRVEP
jgi:hypothetical protein